MRLPQDYRIFTRLNRTFKYWALSYNPIFIFKVASMCIITFQFDPKGSHQLILAANRDEFFCRPSKEVYVWKKNSIIAGKDLQGGGTWLGTTLSGRFAAVTNLPVYEPAFNSETLSRGNLVTSFLTSSLSPEKFVSEVSIDKNKYRGFNLICGDRQSLFYVTNARPGIKELSPGIYSLSNEVLDNTCHRSENTKIKFSQILNLNVTTDVLLNTMKDTNRLENSRPLPKDYNFSQDDLTTPSQIFLEAVCIKKKGKTQHYGTVSTAALIIKKNKNIMFCEDRYKRDGTIRKRSLVKIEHHEK